MDANRMAAAQALELARARHAEGDYAAASRLTEKSSHLYPTPEAESFLALLSKFSEDTKLVNSILKLGAHEHYEALRVDRSASQEAIQQAYLSCARRLHPDKNVALCAAEAFKRVAHAKSVLMDVRLRAAHDVDWGSSATTARRAKRPCERRADRKRKAREAEQHQAARESADEPRPAAAQHGPDRQGPISDSDEEWPSMWCSWQARDSATSAETKAANVNAQRLPGRRRKAMGKVDAAGGAGSAVGFRGGGGAGRGHLGKRPHRRAARVAAKLAAKAAKTRTKARQHLQR